jgi:CHAT domain-containing protein
MLLAAKESPETLLEQARADLDAGRFAHAIENAEACAIDFRAASDNRHLAAALRVIGLARLYSGSYDLAVPSLTEALALSRQLHDFGSEIARLNDLGMASYDQGRYRDALDRYEEAQARVRQVPNDKWSPWARQLTTANIAILYQTLGQYDRALNLYSGLLTSSDALAPAEQAQLLSNVGALRRRLGDPVKALETYRQAQALYRRARNADGEITVLNNIGIVQSMDLGDSKSAESSFSSAIDLAQRTGDRPLAVHAMLNRGEARYRSGQVSASQSDFSAALAGARELGLKDEEWKALYGLSRNPATAPGAVHAALFEATGLIETLRGTAGSADLRSTFLADKRAVYDRLIETSTTAEDAFRWMEQSRARTLLDRSHVKPKSLEEMQRELPSDTAVLEYWLGRNAAAVIWISKNRTGIRRWVPQNDKLAQVRQVLADPHRDDWRAAMQPLADQLLANIPVLTDTQIRRVRIIPDGPLTLVPFEALPLNPTELMVQKFAISYGSSATLSGSADPQRSRIRWPWQRSLAAFADPQPGHGPRDGRTWSRLPQSRMEAAEAARIIGGKTEVLLGAGVRKPALTAAASFPIVHLATHAEADLQDPERSFVLLAPTAENQSYDYLFSKEVSSLPFRTDLVTLSACDTNVGVFIPGEGLRGFPEAFLSAGARSVLSSLWAVGDVSTEQLMNRFYSELRSGNSAAEALRRAKLEFVAHPESSHPAHWAPFVLNGDGDWTLPPLVDWVWFWTAGLLMAALAVYLKLR